ncbi:hypothetical protein BB561_004793 [Smittium simulii]|uniref:Phosphoribosylaminoimidazole carboxylase n=1 Tax=Smittium simulii TaxID=133385 RepID=A0A2T9YEA9_9FUNG|nr:hypothetical protein BB561_004793 [Smittium simulii]
MSLIKQKVGVLGGGQLGRMMMEAAHRLNVELIVVDPQTDSPAKQLSSNSHIDLPFTEPNAIMELANRVDVITVEIEHVDTKTLIEIVENKFKDKNINKKNSRYGVENVNIYPSPQTVKVIQDKYLQHKILQESSIAVAPFLNCSTLEAAVEAANEFSYPFLLKAKRGAYDGRGNVVVKSKEQLYEAWNNLSSQAIPTENSNSNDSGIYAEKMINFSKELAVMVVQELNGEVSCYPVVETIQKDNICHVVWAPAPIDGLLMKKAQTLACEAIKALNSISLNTSDQSSNQNNSLVQQIPKSAGIFGVELFLLENGDIILNEVAPRPHNSGHYTIEACETSQYENHLRAIMGLPIGSTQLKVNYSAMINLLGKCGTDDSLPPNDENNIMSNIFEQVLGVPGATLHSYGKKYTKNGRKMGHVTVVSDSPVEIRNKVNTILNIIDQNGLGNYKNVVSLQNLIAYKPAPLVGIIMGSDSDLPVMKLAANQLNSFGIPFELTIVSAHRTPERMVQYAQTAKDRGLQVIIAGAGGAAHLPGMVAALTPLPVIGVPVKGRCLDGVDSLYSIVQMPRGVPVATVAINNADNAGLLAARILGARIPTISNGVIEYMAQIKDEVETKIEKLESVGYENY